LFENVIVGVDDDEGGRDAVALARDLAGADAAMTLAHVHGAFALLGIGSSSYTDEETARSRELLERTRRETGVDAHLRWIGSPSVGRGLHELAQTEGAELLVVGSNRHGLVGRVLLGDETCAALNGAPCAVAIAPAGESRHRRTIRQIAVGYDGSEQSEHALAVARELAAQYGARLSALHVVSIPASAFARRPGSWEELISDAIDNARQRLAALGGVEPHAVYGRPSEELAQYSAAVDLLVVGSRGYGPVTRLVHGSTSQQLAHSARCPLLVLARADDQTPSAQAHASRRPATPWA